jgi:hypothetical protein
MNLKQPFHCLNHWRRKLFEEESLEIIWGGSQNIGVYVVSFLALLWPKIAYFLFNFWHIRGRESVV